MVIGTHNVAFITGGGGAIGYGIARACLDAGWSVALADVSADALDATMAKLDGARARLVPIILDVRDYEAWQVAADTAEQALGPVTHLFNNAGVTSGHAIVAGGGIESLSVDEWRWTNAVNLDGSFFGMKTFVPRFKKLSVPTHIVTTSSMAGIVPLKGGQIPLSYAASKAAVAHMSAQLRTELAGQRVKHIGLSVLYPGMVKSSINENSLALSPERSGEIVVEPANLYDAVDPADMGRHLLRAIERGDFHIFSHIDWRDAVRAYRTELDDSFVESADPAFTDPAAAMVDLKHARR